MTQYREFTQNAIDEILSRVLVRILVSEAQRGTPDEARRRMKVQHLWFPAPQLDRYELREGNPPADADRPKWLKRKNLVIDLAAIPVDLWDRALVEIRGAKTSKERLVKQQRQLVIEATDDLILLPRHLPRG